VAPVGVPEAPVTSADVRGGGAFRSLPLAAGTRTGTGAQPGGRQLPVLILTAREAWSDKVAGFKSGADDCR
jgi:hypothetical protein